MKNKFAIATGSILALVDFIIVGGRILFFYITDTPRAGEEVMLSILHYPTILIFEPILFKIPFILGIVLIIVSGFVQYFGIGYFVGFILNKIYKRIKASLSEHHTTAR